MKKYTFILLLFLAPSLFGAELFTIDKNNKIIATQNPENTIGLVIDEVIYHQILNESAKDYIIYLPFFTQNLQFRLVKHKAIYDELQITSKTKNGNQLLDIKPNLLTYKMFHNGQSVGIISFVNGEILATFKMNGKQYELSKFKGKYILFEATNSINASNFNCEVEQVQSQQLNNNPESAFTPKCIELAIEIDEYTRLTFANDQETTNWALAIIAGVSQIYEVEINVAIQVVDITIWNTTDPYATDPDCSDILSSLGTYWQANNATIARDLVHFMTKRGLGCGVAWLSALCSNNNGYAVSASLNNDTTYSFPNPTYTWNLEVVAHEIGHNVGAHHTHWCSWLADPTATPPFAGGPIDNCVDVQGTCTNNPTPQVGTIMSYCHIGGNGIILEFHEIVISQAMNPGINNSSCITTCDYYGCTDSLAFNYDTTATIDDSSCVPVVLGCIDSAAANYNPAANTDDSTCTYCFSLTFTVSDISCNGYNDGYIDMLVQSGTGTSSYTYNWTGPSSFSSTIEDIDSLEAGTYTIAVTDTLGCTETISRTINNPLPITIDSLIISHVSCFNFSDGTASVYTSGGTPNYVYNWGGVNPLSLVAGSYSVAITDANNCPQATSNFSITEPNLLVGTYSTIDISCFGFGNGSIDATIMGGVWPYTYSWTGPNTFSNTAQDINSLQSGTYSLTITDANGCLETINPTINEPTAVTVTSNTSDATCNGGSDGYIDISPTGGTQPYSFVWSNGILQEDLMNIAAGQYSVDILDDNGCIVPTLTFTINEPLPSALSVQITSVDCSGDNNGAIDITYVPDVGVPYAFSWTGPNGFSSTLDDITSLYAGTYTLNIIESNCLLTNTYFISEPTAITTLETVQHASCFDSTDASVLLIISGGTPSYITDWGGLNPQSLGAGTYTYTITDDNNCIFSDTVLISQPTMVNVNYNITNVSCYNGINGSVSLNISGGTAPYTSTWQNANPQQLNAGFHLYTIVDNNACVYFDSVFISQPPALMIIENIADALCNGANSGSAILNISGGVAPYSENWYGYNNLALQGGSYLYDVTDANNCIVSGIAIVNEPNPIVAANNIAPSSCPNTNDGQTNVTISGGVAPYQQNWFGINPLSLSAGIYNYTIIDNNGCIDSNQVIVPSVSNITVNSIVNNVSCYGFCDGSINLSITDGIPPYMVNWFAFAQDSLCEGDYPYQVIDDLGCTFDDTITVVMPQPLVLNINLNGVLLDATVSGGTTPYAYFWWDVNGSLGNSQSISTSQSGNYFCVVTDINNCYSDTVSYFFNGTDIVELISDNIKLYPNPFSDFITIEIPMEYKNLTLSLHNVLGEVVLQQNHSNTQLIQILRKDLSSGTYLLCLNLEEIKIWKKLIVE